MVTPELRQELEIRNALQKDLGKLLEARCEEELSVFQGRRPPSPEVCVQAVLEKWFQTGNALSNGPSRFAQCSAVKPQITTCNPRRRGQLQQRTGFDFDTKPLLY